MEDFEAKKNQQDFFFRREEKMIDVQTIIVRVGSLDDNSRSTDSDSMGSRM